MLWITTGEEMRRRGTSRSRTVAGFGRLRWSRRRRGKIAAGSKDLKAIAVVNWYATLWENNVQKNDLKKKKKRPDARIQWVSHPHYLPPGKFPLTMYHVPSVAPCSKDRPKRESSSTTRGSAGRNDSWRAVRGVVYVCMYSCTEYRDLDFSMQIQTAYAVYR